MSDHCEFAPSAFERIDACPATVQRSRDVEATEGTQSRWATEGIYAHSVAAEELGRALGWHDDRDKGLYRDGVDEELRQAVELYVETVMAVIDRANDHVWVEQRVDLVSYGPPAPLWGTSDAIVYKPATGHLFVFDFKYGKDIPVEV